MKSNKIIFLLIITLLMGSVLAAFPEISQINYDPSPATPGSTIKLLVQIENLDSTPQKEVIVGIEDTYPFTVKADEQNPNPKNIGNLAPYGKTTIIFNVFIDPTAENKSYQIPILISNKGETSSKKTNHDILVSGKEPIVKIIRVIEEKLVPGEEKEVHLILKNVGTTPAYHTIIELNEDRTITATGSVIERDLTPLGAATANVGTINPTEEKTAIIKISVSNTATIKNYTLPIQISYNEQSGARKQTTSFVGLKVFGTAEIDATIKEQTSDQITFELFNKGLGTADFVLIEINSDEVEVHKPKQYVGTLASNDVDTIKTSYNKIGIGSNPTEVQLSITYLDSDAKQKTKEMIFKINPKENGEQPNLFLPILALIVILLVGWMFVTKKKEKN